MYTGVLNPVKPFVIAQPRAKALCISAIQASAIEFHIVLFASQSPSGTDLLKTRQEGGMRHVTPLQIGHTRFDPNHLRCSTRSVLQHGSTPVSFNMYEIRQARI